MTELTTSSRTAQGVEPANRKTELAFYLNCNFTEITEIIGDNFVKMPYLGMFFRINPDDTIVLWLVFSKESCIQIR